MATATLDQVIESVKSLSSDEQRRLRGLLDEWLQEQDVREREQKALQWLLENGVISRIPPPITDFSRHDNYQPIQVQGKPISETIIEDRR